MCGVLSDYENACVHVQSDATFRRCPLVSHVCSAARHNEGLELGGKQSPMRFDVPCELDANGTISAYV